MTAWEVRLERLVAEQGFVYGAMEFIVTHGTKSNHRALYALSASSGRRFPEALMHLMGLRQRHRAHHLGG